MTFRLQFDTAPRAAAQFAQLANAGFYDRTAFHAIHPECVVGGDPRSRLGYGPDGTLIRGDFFFGKVREWGSDESRLYGDAQVLCPAYVPGTEAYSPTSGRWEASPCAIAARLPAETGTAADAPAPAFGSLALALGGKPGMTWPAAPDTVGSQFEIYLGGRRSFYGDPPPVIGSLLEGGQVLREIAAVPVSNDYLSERKGRSMPQSKSFARPRDVPVRRVGVARVRVAQPARMGLQVEEERSLSQEEEPAVIPRRLVRTAASVIAAGMLMASAATAAVAVDTSSLGIPGTWSLKETRAGNLCEARASFAPDSDGALVGRATVRSPCFDTGSGAYRLVLDGEKPTFGWALEYEKSIVFYSATQVEAASPGGTVKAKGIIRAAQRSAPEKGLAPVGTFAATAKLPSRE